MDTLKHGRTSSKCLKGAHSGSGGEFLSQGTTYLPLPLLFLPEFILCPLPAGTGFQGSSYRSLIWGRGSELEGLRPVEQLSLL